MTASGIITTSIALLMAMALPQPSHAQDNATTLLEVSEPTMCSCSPTVFTFVLNLETGSCDLNTIEANPGIDGSFCFVESGVALPAPPGTAEQEITQADAEVTCQFCPDGLPDPDYVLPTDDGATCRQAQDLAATLSPEDDVCKTVQFAEALCCLTATTNDTMSNSTNLTTVEEEPVRRLLSSLGLNSKRSLFNSRRSLQDSDDAGMTTADGVVVDPNVDPNAVVEVVSVQFIEFDTSGDLTVINQDDTYSDVSLANGDRLKFYSASSLLDTSLPLDSQMSSPALVPGGASLIIYGKTASGEVVRNRFFWMYDMNCERDNSPVNPGDQIGWVTLDGETSGPWPTFCPAQPDSPTISPRTNEPTLTPSKSPILSPSKSPTASPGGMMSYATAAPAVWGGSVEESPIFSKSSKVPKTHKPGKADKEPSSKASKISSKSSKGTKNAKPWDGSSWSYSWSDIDGKSGKDANATTTEQYFKERDAGFTVERVSLNGAADASHGHAWMVLMSSAVMTVMLLFPRQ